MIDYQKHIKDTKKMAEKETEPKKKKLLEDYADLLAKAEKLSVRFPQHDQQTMGSAVGVQ